MSVRPLREPPPPELARALAEFEAQFSYPLGPGRRFRISHGDDYPRFFRAMGDGSCFVAEQDACVVGVLGVAVRGLLLPAGGECRAAYVGDLKVAPAARGSRTFLQLVRAGDAWVRPRVTAAFGVVMDGTRATPETYTGRVGIPAFRALGTILVWQLPANAAGPAAEDGRFLADAGHVRECYLRLSRGRYASPGGAAAERSLMTPVPLLHPDGEACGVLEDTRRAKRLLADDGTELRSAHLSSFAYRSAPAAGALIHVARRLAADGGHPALFVAVAPEDAAALAAALGPLPVVVAPATIYGTGLEAGPSWNLDTSEI